MSEMTERVARAIHAAMVKDFTDNQLPMIREFYAKHGRIGQPIGKEYMRFTRSWDEMNEADWSNYRLMARAAIEAMREPTDARQSDGPQKRPIQSALTQERELLAPKTERTR